MKTASALFAYVAIVASAAALEPTTIPADILLIYPNVTVNKNHLVTLGFGHGEEKTLYGLMRNISMSLTYPNGTKSGDLVAEYGGPPCTLYSGFGAGTNDLWVNETGLYTVSWNSTYGTPPDPSQISDIAPCGYMPLSFQSIIVNATFEVADLGVVFNPEQTHTTRLPVVPTGTVHVQSGASTSSEMGLLFVGSATLVIMAMLA